MIMYLWYSSSSNNILILTHRQNARVPIYYVRIGNKINYKLMQLLMMYQKNASQLSDVDL